MARKVKIQRVVDGDSLEVKYGGLCGFMRRPFAVRLYAIDAPELAQPYGREARSQLTSLVRRGGIRMEEIATDRYGRRVGLLYRSRRGRQQSINLMMVRSGMAYWYRRYGGRELGFPEAEAEAKSQRRGVWRDERGSRRPWDHRADIRQARRRRRRLRRFAIWCLIVVIVATALAGLLLALELFGYGVSGWPTKFQYGTTSANSTAIATTVMVRPNRNISGLGILARLKMNTPEVPPAA